jgi:peptidoglycan/xylan/chitin deacetylase (PgdA/CDA1 family)
MGIVKDILYKISSKNYLKRLNKQSVFPYYHLVRDDKVAHIEHLYRYKNIAQFTNDLEILCDNYQRLAPGDLVNDKFSDNQFLLTFDDGLSEIYTVIYPILKRKGIKAIFFVNPDFVDNTEGLYKHYISIILTEMYKGGFNKGIADQIAHIFGFTYAMPSDFKKQFIAVKYADRHKMAQVFALLGLDINAYLKEHKPYITKEQIQEMLDDGFYFGGHTMSHPPLNQLTVEAQKAEIINSIEWLKTNFNIKYSLFAFPFSDKAISKKLLDALFRYDSNIKMFGNSGIKKDVDSRIIQRFSLENPDKDVSKVIVTENFYKYFNKAIGKYKIKRP